MHKQEMERQWRRPGVAQNANLSRWTEGGRSETGEARNPTISAAALKFQAAVGRDEPVWSRTAYTSYNWPLEPSAELRARYKADCPNNYRALLASFGKTRTKYDHPDQYL